MQKREIVWTVICHLAQWVWLMFHSLSWLSVDADTMSVLFRNFTYETALRWPWKAANCYPFIEIRENTLKTFSGCLVDRRS